MYNKLKGPCPIGPKRFSCFSLFCAKIMDEDKEIISEPVSKRPRLLFRILGNLYQEDLKLSKPKLPNLFRPGTVYNPDGSIIKKNLPLSSSSNEALIPVPFLSMTAEIKRTCPLIRDHLLQGDLWEAAGIPRIEATCQIGDLSIFNCESKVHGLVPAQVKNLGVRCSLERPSIYLY